jgi:hypothetical protein
MNPSVGGKRAGVKSRLDDEPSAPPGLAPREDDTLRGFWVAEECPLHRSLVPP